MALSLGPGDQDVNRLRVRNEPSEDDLLATYRAASPAGDPVLSLGSGPDVQLAADCRRGKTAEILLTARGRRVGAAAGCVSAERRLAIGHACHDRGRVGVDTESNPRSAQSTALTMADDGSRVVSKVLGGWIVAATLAAVTGCSTGQGKHPAPVPPNGCIDQFSGYPTRSCLAANGGSWVTALLE
jgi:hypothetical protein